MISFPSGVEIVADELRDLLLDEIGEDLRAGVVALGAELGLRLGAQEGLTDELAVELHLVERVAEQRAARGHRCFARTVPRWRARYSRLSHSPMKPTW